MTEHLSHDLPDYVPNAPARREAERAKVYKSGLYWTWHHTCLDRPASTPVNGYPHEKQSEALRWALKHMNRCL